jgi:Cdc6-like AAA superfamily ATPase
MEVLNRAMELARDQGEAEVSPDHLREALRRQDETGV